MTSQAARSTAAAGSRACRRIVFLWFALISAAPAARVVAEYRAGIAGNSESAPAPAVSGWLAGVPGNDAGNFKSEPLSPDGATGYNAWRMLDDSGASGQFITWTHPVAAADHGAAATQGWTLAARLRVADPLEGNAGGRSVVLLYGNGSRRWGLFFDVDQDGTLVATFSSGGATVRLPDLAADGYHDHQLVFDPARATTDYLVNGRLAFSGYNGESSGFNGVQWGTGSSGGRGDGYWNQVSLAIADRPVSGGRPKAVIHPESRAVAEGGSVTMKAAFEGEITGYQWFMGDEPVSGATGTTLTLAAVAPEDAGDYWCRAYAGDAHAGSATAALAVLRPGAGLVLSEFLAGNGTGLRDGDGERGDWIEIFNAGTAPASTAGWFLTDDPLVPSKWPLPDELLPPGGFRIVWADGKDRGVAGGGLHANFAISKSGGYVALVRPDLSAATAFTYPPQTDDVSHGLSVHHPPRVKFFTPATPGALNRDGRTAADDGITFGLPPGLFTAAAEVTLETGLQGGVLRFTSDGTRPEFDSPAYTEPVSLSETTQLRAAVVFPGERHGATATAGYLLAGPDLQGFSSPLPLVVLSNFGGGEIPGGSSRGPRGDGGDVVRAAGQPQVLTILVGASGETTPASPAVHQSRAGMRRRGSSSFNFSVGSYRLETWGEHDGQAFNASLLGMPEENDWVLYGPDASQFDITLLHNSFTYELARQSGFSAPRFRFVELFVDSNGDGELSMADHKGLSILMENPKRDSARIPFRMMSDDGRQGGWMVNIDRMDALPPGSGIGSLAPRHFHTAGPDRLLQTPDDNPIGLSNNDDQPNFYHSFFNFDSPRGWDILPAQREVIQSSIRDFDAALYGGNFTDPDLGYARHIDLRNWAQHLAIHCLARNQDAVVLSSYLYRETPDAPIRWASIWDFDRAYARMGAATSNLNWAHDRLYYKRMTTDPEFLQVYIDVWQDLRRGAFATENLHAIIADQAAVIGPVVAARSGLAESTWSARLDEMKSWLGSRAAAMDALHTAPAGFSPPGGPVSTDAHLVISAPNGTIYYTTDGSDPRLRGGGPAPSAHVYHGVLPIGQTAVVTARVLAGGQWSGVTRGIFYKTSEGPRFLPGGSASWTENSHWESAPSPYPDGAGRAATVGPPASGDRNVDLLAAVTMGFVGFPQEDSVFRNRLRGEAAGHRLTFDGGSAGPARLHVGGAGAGFVEIDVAAGVRLESQLELAVENPAGDPAHGALRLRRDWSGPGGLTKLGAGTATLTGGGKGYTGPTLVEEGVLQVTGSAAPSETSGVSVFDGGQLRLISQGAPVYTFGGDIVVRGSGRAGDLSGALRFDPGSGGNHALLTSPVEPAGHAGIHVAGSTNILEFSQPLRGSGSVHKSGGGTLALSGDGSGFLQPITLGNGTLRLRGAVGSSITIGAEAVLDAAGVAGPLTGTGRLLLNAGILESPLVDGLRHALVFGAGDALLVTSEVRAPAAIDLYLDLPAPPDPPSRVRGGYLLPLDAPWKPLLGHPELRVHMPDPAGAHAFDGRFWSQHPAARVTRVPNQLAAPQGVISGRILEIRFDGAPLTFADWRAVVFSDPEQSADPAVSGHTAAPFGDGIANLIRFALGGGEGEVRERLPRMRRDGRGVAFLFPYDPGLRGLRWIVESVDDPGDWSAAAILFDSATSPARADRAGWLTVHDDSADPSRFYRLRVEEADEF